MELMQTKQQKLMNLLLTLATVALLTLSFAAPFLHHHDSKQVYTPECIACVVQYHWQATAPGIGSTISVSLNSTVSLILPETDVQKPVFPGFIFVNKAPPFC